MTRKKTLKPSDRVLRMIPTRSSYSFGAETAVELELLAMVGNHGAKQEILEQAFRYWYGDHQLKAEARNAGLQLLEYRYENGKK